MKRTVLLMLFLSLPAGAQAVRPAPAQPVPLIQQQPPSYPGATYTPAGAGASHGGLAAPRPAVERSKNTRFVPPEPDGVPGLWAADEVRASGAKTPPEIAGVPLPLGADGKSALARSCADTVSEQLKPGGRLDDLFAVSPSSRRCTVAHLFADCVEASKHVDPNEYKVYGRNRARVIATMKAVREDAAYADTKRAKEFVREACQGTSYDLMIVNFMQLTWAQIRKEYR